jgi:hypothetical protein
MKNNNWQTAISIIVTGAFTAYAMMQPKLTPTELSLYGFTVIYRWIELIVAILIITWGYKLFKKINNIK